MSRRLQDKAGFTLIELVMVVLIITILTGIAIPYYGDYIRDARRSTLKQNLANFRKVLNDFRGDHGRGPFQVPIYTDNGSSVVLDNAKSAGAKGCELIAGPIQVSSDGIPTRRSGFKYLPGMPILEDPESAARIEWSYGTSSLYFINDNSSPENQFDLDKDFAFIDNNNNSKFDGAATDTVYYLFNTYPSSRYDPLPDGTASTAKALDFISIVAADSTGMKY